MLVFSETVTVKGNPRITLHGGALASYESGSGTDTLIFAVPDGKHGKPASVDFNGGVIIGSEATAALRIADLSLP